MKAPQHRLVGYDRVTELERFELPIPESMVLEVGKLVRFDDDDPEAIGCYELSYNQARQIAIMVNKNLPTGLSFFLEAHAA